VIKGSVKNVSPFEMEMLNMFPSVVLKELVDDLPAEKTTKKNLGSVSYVVEKDYIQFTTELPTLQHEIAHTIEMKISPRLLEDDWGISMRSDFTHKSFFVALAREARVRGIQHHIRPYKDVEFGNPYWFETLAPKYIGFGRFKSVKDVKDWATNILENTYLSWSKDRVIEEWKKRVEYIRNWQETK
jgi:hypothetical protein